MVDDPKPNARVIAAYLDDVADELEAVRRLAAPPSLRVAAFHLQQAAEKLTKAVRLKNGIPATADHNLEHLLSELSPTEPWAARLKPFEWLSAFATAYRYPTPGGRRNPGPAIEKLSACVQELAALLEDARRSL